MGGCGAIGRRTGPASEEREPRPPSRVQFAYDAPGLAYACSPGDDSDAFELRGRVCRPVRAAPRGSARTRGRPEAEAAAPSRCSRCPRCPRRSPGAAGPARCRDPEARSAYAARTRDPQDLCAVQGPAEGVRKGGPRGFRPLHRVPCALGQGVSDARRSDTCARAGGGALGGLRGRRRGRRRSLYRRGRDRRALARLAARRTRLRGCRHRKGHDRR